MTAASWQLLIDLNRDNLFNHALSDLSAYLLSARWNNGMNKPYDEFAQPAQMDVTLDNSGGAFDPERAAATYYNLITRGQHVRLRATFNSTTYTLFDGVLTDFKLDIGLYGQKQATLRIQDHMLALLDSDYSPPLQTDVTTDQPLRTMLDTGIVALPYPTSHWMLDYSQLGTNTTLVDPTLIYSFETGKSTLGYVGDQTGSEEGTSAQRFARDVVASEMGGRFFYNAKQALFVFHSRHSFVGRSVSFTLTEDNIDSGDYDTGISEIVNVATVSYTPRIVLGTTIVYSSGQIYNIDYLETKVIKARYRDTSNTLSRIGLLTGIQPVLGADYTVTNIAELDQQNDPTWVTVNAVFGGTEAQIIIISNPASYGRVIQVSGLQLRGSAIGQYDQASVSWNDSGSMAAYGRQETTRSLKVASANDALAYAQWLVNEFKSPRPRMKSVSFIASKSDTLMTQALARQIGDVIAITMSSKNHDAKYELVGEQHQLRMGGEHTLTTKWVIRPLRSGWQLETAGYGELGETTYLGL